MSLRDQIDQLMADHDPTVDTSSAIDDLFDSGEFEDLDSESLVDALRHYADSSPIDIADALSGFLTDHSDIPLEEFDPTTVTNDHGDLSLVGFGAAQLGSEAYTSVGDSDGLDDDPLGPDDPDISDGADSVDDLHIDATEIDPATVDSDSYLVDASDDADLSFDDLDSDQPGDDLDFDF